MPVQVESLRIKIIWNIVYDIPKLTKPYILLKCLSLKMQFLRYQYYSELFRNLV